MSVSSVIKEKYPPGDFAIWIIIYVELITFGLLFLGYAFSRRADVAMFNESQLMLSQTSGFINTLILITSSYFVVKAVRSVTSMNEQNVKDANTQAAKYLLFALMLGISFLFVKALEFYHIFSMGISLSTNKFFMFYIMLTGFHFMHVMLGSFILFVLYKKTKSIGYSFGDYRGIETGASYWHMVDLLWIVLFPLVYIIR